MSGGHNALLDAAYDPWARNGLLSPLPTICGPIGTGNQPLGLKLVFKPKVSLCGLIHSFFHN